MGEFPWTRAGGTGGVEPHDALTAAPPEVVDLTSAIMPPPGIGHKAMSKVRKAKVRLKVREVISPVGLTVCTRRP